MFVLSVMLPIFLVFLVGYIGQIFLKLNTVIISKMAIYMLVPFLVFRTFYTNRIDSSFFYSIIFLLLLCFISIIIISVFSKLANYSETQRCGLILSSAFMNNGNYGTPLILFLFGKTGLQVAIVLMVLQQLIMSTLGVYYAAKGSSFNMKSVEAFRQVLYMPMIYGALLGIFFNYLHIPLGTLSKGIDFIADSAIPVVMLSLGMQLANLTIKRVNWKSISFSVILRLLISPIIAFLIVSQFPIDDLTKKIMIIIAATPTAANTTMYAIQFQVEEDNVSASTLISTILSLITIPLVIYVVL
ncbi:AEC family transporter [Mammaliicoccus lentus]|uniref:AEC family transporter n=1 Tax=Mammaliicoccus lentus TaxID=42858 RepID=UPI0027F16065|nr:AEC family transporter [Mammaliicoccus lentus]MDQ7143603.1 AEC family transporter [Mammaliicoccus lentus]